MRLLASSRFGGQALDTHAHLPTVPPVMVLLSGPTSFAPIVEAAVRTVEESGGQYHVLLIVADGQVTRSSDLPPGEFSPQERATIDAIVAARWGGREGGRECVLKYVVF